MAKRKSLNRRLSRYSRNSTGSAFLDPDTENWGDEQPYWWKNLENNTVMRPSMSCNTPNRTSPILDPNSRIDSGEPQDGWWKVLETTDIADDAKLTMSTRKADADNNTVTTSESEEEPRIIKRKLILRSAARKSRDNPFVNILESETLVEKSIGESPSNKSGSIDKGTTSSKRVNKIPESSSDQSHGTDVVLKLKPTLFKRRHKDRQRNVFDDVLKENEQLTPKKRKSLRLSSHSKIETLRDNKIPAVTESPIVKQGGSSQLVLSFENDHDLLRLPNPEAQSTLLESSSSIGSNKDANNSEMEARVLKPKSIFLKRPKRGADKNVFADILAEEETHNDVEISKWKEKGIDANAEASKKRSVGQAGGSLHGPKSTSGNVVNEIRTGDAKATKGSIPTESITPPAQDPRGPVEPNALAQASVASSDTSDKSQDRDTFLKPRSTFLKRSRKRPETNIFQEILEEDDNVDALRRSRSDILVDRTKKDLMMENQATVAREAKRRRIIDQESNTGSEELHLELASSSEENIAWPDENNAKETSELYRSTCDSDIDVSEVGSEPKEKRQRRSALHVSPEIPEMSNRRTANLPRIINEVSNRGGSGTWDVRHRESASDVDVSVTSKHEEGNRTKSPSRNQHERDILEENKGSSHKLYTQLSIDTSDDSYLESEVIEITPRKVISKLGNPSFRSTVDDSEPDDLQSTPSRPSKKLRTSIRQSTVITPRDTDLEPVLSTPKRQSKSLSKSQKLLSSRVISEAEVEDVQATPKRQSRSSSRSQKLLSSRAISEDEAEDVQVTSKRQSRSLSKSKKLLSSRGISEDEAEDVQVTSKRQSRSSSRSQELLSSRVMSESEAEDVQVTSKRQSRSSSRSQELLSSRAISEDEAEDVQVTSKRQSRSLSKSKKLLSSRVISEAEVEDVQETPKRQSRSLSKPQKLLSSRVISEAEVEDAQATPKRQSRSSSRSQKLLSSRAISEDEAEDVQATSKRQTRSLSKSKKLLSSRGISEDEAEDVQVTSKRQSRSSSRSQKLLSSRAISEDEAEDVQATSKRQIRSLSKSKKLLSSRGISEDEAEDVQVTSKRQSKSLSKSKKLLSSDEAEDVQATSKRQSKSLSKSQIWLSLRVMSESETEDVQVTSKRQSRRLSKSQKLLSSRVISEDEAEDVQETPTRQSRSLSKSQKLLSSRVISEDEAEDVQATSQRQSRSLNKSQKLLSSRVISEDEAEDVQATSQRQSRSLSKSQKLLSSRVISDDEAEDVQATPKRKGRSSSKSQKLLSSRVMSESETEDVQETPKKQSRSLSKSKNLLSSDEAEDVQATSQRQSRSLSKSQKLLSSRVISDDEAEDVQATPKRKGRSSSKSQKLLSSRVMSESETEDVQETPKKQSRSLSKSKNLLSSDEAEDVQATSQRQSRSLSKSQKLLSSRVISDDEAEDVQATPKRKGRSSSKSQKLLSSRVMSESETEDVQETPKKQSRSLSKSKNLLSSDEAEDVQATSQRQSKSLSKSQKWLSLRVMSESETEDVQAIPKRKGRNSSKSQKLLSSRVMSEDEAEDVQVTSKKQSRSLSKSQKLVSSRVMSESETDDVPETPKRQSRSLSKSKKLLSSRVISEDEAEDVQATSKRQSKSLSKSQKLLSLRVMSESETEDVQETPKRQSRNSSRSQKLLSSRAISEDEAEDVPVTSKRQSRNSSNSQKLLSSRVMSEDEAEEIQSTRKTRESKSVGKAQNRSTSNAIKESEDPNTPERRSKVLSKLPNDISSAANQIEPCEIDSGAKGQSKSISRVERQSTERIVNVSETKEVESSRQKHSRNFMSREPSVSPVRRESELTVPITGESNMHRVQEEEEEEEIKEEEEEEEKEEEGGGVCLSSTRRSEQRIAFNPNVTKDREDGDLLNASSKSAKEAKDVSRDDTRRNVGENRSVASGKAKGSVGSARTSTNRGKDSSRSQRNIEDFLIVRKAAPASQVFSDKQKAEEFKRELEKIKKQAMDDMQQGGNSREGKLPLQQKKPSNFRKTAKATQKQRPAKPIHKAFLVNGQVYKVPRLPRPKHWVTDRLYKYLWKRLEPKYTLQTRVISEKFVQQLSNVMSFIVKQKSYASYRAELYALLKEMARLETRKSLLSSPIVQEIGIKLKGRGKLGSHGTARRGATRYDKTGPAEVINRAAQCSGAVFGRVTPTSAHRSGSRTNAENSRRSKINPVPRTISLPAKKKLLAYRTYTDTLGAACRYVEEIAQQVRAQTPQGHQETVDEEPQGEKVGKLDLLALGHAGPRDNLFVVVPAVSGHQKHRHLHDVRGRELGGLRLDVLLLRRVRGESEEREHRERDDHLTLTGPTVAMDISVAALAATDMPLPSRDNPAKERADPSHTCRARSANRRMVGRYEARNRKIAYRISGRSSIVIRSIGCL